MPSRRHAAAITRLRRTSATRKTKHAAPSMAMADSDCFVTVGPDAASFGGGIGTWGSYDLCAGAVAMIVDVVWLRMVAFRMRTCVSVDGTATPGATAHCRHRAFLLLLARRRTLVNIKRDMKSWLIVSASSANRAGAAGRFRPYGQPVQSRRLSAAMDALIRNAKDVGGTTSVRRDPTRVTVMRVGSR
jgi:hypothetical protein